MGLSIPEVARVLVTCEGNVFRWESGIMPRPVQLEKIVAFTGGEVTVSDFVSYAAQKAREGGK